MFIAPDPRAQQIRLEFIPACLTNQCVCLGNRMLYVPKPQCFVVVCMLPSIPAVSDHLCYHYLQAN